MRIMPAYAKGESYEMDNKPLVTDACDCTDWKINILKVDSAAVLAWTHGMEYDGKKFIYCPWCGTKLRESED